MGRSRIGIIGGGPAGLMAAETAAGAGAQVTVLDAMPTVGRKFLMAGKSGLNLTHAEAHERFRARFGETEALLRALDDFDGVALRDWCAALGVQTFVGSSGRVFPTAMKGSPLLRAWLARLAEQGVEIRTRWRWQGFAADALVFDAPDGRREERFDAVVLALGGASWPRLGSDAAWVPWLEGAGVDVAPFRPANVGFEVNWSPVFVERFAGQPVKAVAVAVDGVPGEFVVNRWGIEGSLVYAHSAALRDRLEIDGVAQLRLDLVPGRTVERLATDLARQKPKDSFANCLRKGAGLDGVKAGLLRELVTGVGSMEAAGLARQIKDLALPVQRARPIAEAISSAGGIAWEGVDERFMLRRLPGVFAAGEMLDWEAPTGGYLLTACFATGKAAGLAAAQWAP